MIIQYNGFTPLRIVLKYLFIVSVEVVFIRFFGKSIFNPRGKRTGAKKS
ncbi:hypothetical protein CHCC15381_3952 [Bacillus paralicheniformis]|uniref:Uncharacterized protein n=1 Tax=Bacillus paralicheniformis TaxID=1648923 RepID=A0ABY3FYE4_9BACI|nr:hypothetical protein CHCC15381_3952 [Bacillus paralicheniformis]